MGYVIAAIPCYNEGTTIGSVVLKAKQHVSEVVVVDDGSTDDTAEVAALAGAHVIRHARNLGKGMAIRSAWLYARERTPDALVLLDGDHQHEPNDIARLVAPILNDEVDVALGVRWGKTSRMPTYRRVGKRVLDYATAAGVKNGMLTDSQCGYRAFSWKALEAIEPRESGLAIESQMLVEAQERGLRIREASVNARYDLDGSTISPGRHGLGVLAAVISLVSEKRPLFFFGIPGMALLAAAALLGIHVVQIFYATGGLAVGYAFLVVLLVILVGLSIVLFEVLAEYFHYPSLDYSFLFPLLILAWTAERYMEEVDRTGWEVPSKKLFGTLALVLAAYGVMVQTWLVDAVLLTPLSWPLLVLGN